MSQMCIVVVLGFLLGLELGMWWMVRHGKRGKLHQGVVCIQNVYHVPYDWRRR